tara:strand:+ start:24847 stop:26649 length:1803 start_codon:yes stop_codon:yes gene_type:complete
MDKVIDFDESSYDNLNAIQLIRKSWTYISNRKKSQSYFLLIAMVISGAIELLTLALIMPFLYVLQSPDDAASVIDNKLPFPITHYIDISNIYIMGAIFILTLSISTILRLFVLWYGGALTSRIGAELGSQSYIKVLNQPYEFHKKANTSFLISTINGHTDSAIGGLTALMQLITATIVVIFILFGLILLNPMGAISSLFLFSGLYIMTGIWAKKRIKYNSLLVSSARTNQIKTLQEGLGAIRDIILDHSQNIYYNKFKKHSYILRTSFAFTTFLAAFPKYVLELIGLAFITILAMIINNTPNWQMYTIPILGTIALAAQRLLPSMQQIYSGWANMNAAKLSFAYINELLNLEAVEVFKNNKPFKLKNDIVLKSLSFKYNSKNSKYIFKNLNYTIKAGQKVGILGQSGGGKSTLVDLIMGLLKPMNGEVLIDGINLNQENSNEFLIRWRSSIAHVPQSIFLSDDSIANNIAFSSKENGIDSCRLRESAAKAQLLNFILSLPEGFNSQSGERGAMLSGGQRQRIGLARAFYKNASLLILDEATSALDHKNEELIINSIECISKEITVIIISHRISTLKKCDTIISIDKGNIIEIPKSKLFPE